VPNHFEVQGSIVDRLVRLSSSSPLCLFVLLSCFCHVFPKTLSLFISYGRLHCSSGEPRGSCRDSRYHSLGNGTRSGMQVSMGLRSHKGVVVDWCRCRSCVTYQHKLVTKQSRSSVQSTNCNTHAHVASRFSVEADQDGGIIDKVSAKLSNATSNGFCILDVL
jgi:hypothetical protein